MARRIRTKEQTVFARLKSLRRDLREKTENRCILQQEFERIKRELETIIQEEERLTEEIDQIQEQMKEPEVTDHAIVQFFNRCLGYDIDAVKELMLNERLKELVSEIGGTGKFPFSVNNPEELREQLVREDFKPAAEYSARMKRGFVVTVLE